MASGNDFEAVRKLLKAADQKLTEGIKPGKWQQLINKERSETKESKQREL